MNIEQLQLILNTLQNMGVEGKSAFLWWLAFDKALPVIGWLLTFLGFMWIVGRITATVVANACMRELRDEMRIGSPGFLTDNESRAVMRKVQELMRK